MITEDTNNKIIEWAKTYAWVLWVAFILGFSGINVMNIRWWIFFIPLVIFVDISKKAYFISIVRKHQEILDREKEEKEKLDFFK